MNNLFYYAGASLLIIYFAAFYWVFSSAGKEITERYNRTFSGQMKFNFIGCSIIAVAFFVSDLLLSSTLFVIALIWATWATIKQNKEMIVVGFDSVFRSRLYKVSFIALLAIGILFAGKIAGTLDAT